ncbi:hypothetical protein [Mumia sp. Pv 4-285]|uniref:hypothetical protein n=1 Tax=Mumia qirimensis TaxID=3234852 RepID=UPI00351D1884
MIDLRPRRLVRSAWWLVRFEVSLYVSLARWVARRPDHGDGATPYGYARLVSPVICLWIFASAAEIPLVHVLLPWEGLRLALLVLGVWGLAWMVGLLASMHVYPHLVTDQGIRVRSGPSFAVFVPWSAVTAAAKIDRDLPSTIRTIQIDESGTGTDAAVPVSGRVNVTLTLRDPMTVPTREGERSVDSVSLWVDEPRELVALARQRVSAPR